MTFFVATGAHGGHVLIGSCAAYCRLVTHTGTTQFLVAYSTVEGSGSTESHPIFICRHQLKNFRRNPVLCIVLQARLQLDS